MSTATVNLITAVPGSGKSLYVVKMIDELLQPRYDPDGQLMPMRQIYTNIDGLKREKFKYPANIHLFETPIMSGEDIKIFDWRDCPEGSVVIYDEAHFFFPQAKQTPDILLELTIARHKGIELYFVTQDASQLHHQIRNLVGNHKHLYNALGAKASSLYEWQHFCAAPNSRYEQTRAQQSMFVFPKQYYDWYVSANTHTKKLVIPKQIKRLAFFIIAIFSLVAYSFYSRGGLRIFQVEKDEQQIEVSQSAPLEKEATNPAVVAANEAEEKSEIDLSKPYGWAALPSVPAVRGCVANKRKNWCQCFGENNTPLQMSHAQCLSVLSKPLPFSSSVNYSAK